MKSHKGVHPARGQAVIASGQTACDAAALSGLSPVRPGTHVAPVGNVRGGRMVPAGGHACVQAGIGAAELHLFRWSFGAGRGTRTLTFLSENKDLNLACLPIPPAPRPKCPRQFVQPRSAGRYTSRTGCSSRLRPERRDPFIDTGSDNLPAAEPRHLRTTRASNPHRARSDPPCRQSDRISPDANALRRPGSTRG